MADSLLTVTVGLLEEPATVTERALLASEDASGRDALARLVRELGGLTAKDAKVIARVDSMTRTAAAGTCVADVTDCTAGDTLDVFVPGRGTWTLTVIDGTPDHTAGEVDLNAADDTAFGVEIANCFNTMPGLKEIFSAASVTGTVTITAKRPGTWGNSVNFTETAASNSPFAPTDPSGGTDILGQPTMTVTFGSANIVADNKISIGARVYTWKASASALPEITLSTTEATAAANFVTAVNSDAHMTGICTASRADAVVTLTFLCDPRLAKHIGVDFTETNSGSVSLGGVATGGISETPTPKGTVTGSSTTRTYARGAA